MKLATALSWMHLFEQGASFECDNSAPKWMRELIDATTKARGLAAGANAHTIRISANDSENCDSFVGIASRVTDETLRASGFTHIRRFAVLPDLPTARWFVPLDSPAVSSAAFSLYSPAKLSARLKVAAARIATYSRLPVWYRHELVIARRAPGPIEQKIGEVLGTTDFRIALSSGAPEPARNRKVSLAVIALNGTLLAFAKIAGSELSDQLLYHEQNILPELKKRGIAAPELLFAGTVDGARMTLQRPLPGKPVSSKLTASKLDFLASLRFRSSRRASESNLVASLPNRIANLPAARPDLLEALHDVLPTLEQIELPSTIVHGDFAPWNLREHDGTIAAFDWEYAELDGLPLIDEIHYRLQVGYLLEKWTAGKACEEIAVFARQCNPAPLAASRIENAEISDSRSLERQSEPLPNQEHTRALVVVYLLDQLTRLLSEGYDESENDMVAWDFQLLRKLIGANKTKEVAAA